MPTAPSVRRLLVVALAAGATLLALTGTGSAGAGPGAVLHACAAATGHDARCFASYLAPVARPAAADAVPAGYGPADLRAAYRYPARGGAGRTVAIVDAFDSPTAEADLGVYRRHFGLPPCTTANGCFRKVNQRGAAGPLPAPEPGWGVEIALDLDMVSAACPDCSLLLVEGSDPSLDALGTAVDTAVRLGASVVSNSYGTVEFNGMQAFAGHYRHPGVAVVASSGDFGFTTASFPAVLGPVLAVGGTRLSRTAAGGFTEQAWDRAGSGCSAYVAKPAWQTDRHCPGRVTADVSAVADPATGLAVYDTFGLGAQRGWLVVGGTSASAPLVAGLIALAGQPGAVDSSYPYDHRSGFRDVVGGSNGFCGGDYLCTGRPGYDAPTGLGSPRGLAGL